MSNSPYNSNYDQEPASDSYDSLTLLPGQRRNVVPTLAYTASGGLLVGIVAGLLLISGGGKASAGAATADETPRAVADGPIVSSQAPTSALTEAGETVPDATSADAGTGDSADNNSADTNSADNNVPLAKEPEQAEAHLRFEVRPADIADIEIRLDGQVITNMAWLVSLDAKDDPKTVKIVASADGYRDFKKKVRVSGDTRISIEMKKIPKRVVAEKTSTSKARPPSKESPKATKDSGKKANEKPPGPGGLLNL